MKAINDVCRIRRPLTVAVIPYSPLARETAEIAHQNGLEILLHLPLESINETQANSMDGIILSGMSRRKITEVLEADLNQIPYIKGVNNHMGSKITGNSRIMRQILEELQRRRLFFIDSFTTGDSIGFKQARKMRIPTARRDVFLDGILNEDYIRERLNELFRRAAEKGSAIGIGHPNPVTLGVLEKELPLIEKHGLRLVLVSEIIH